MMLQNQIYVCREFAAYGILTAFALFFFSLSIMPLDQSAAYIWGLFQKKNSVFGPFWGNEEDLRGTKQAKFAPNFGALLGGAILTIKLG